MKLLPNPIASLAALTLFLYICASVSSLAAEDAATTLTAAQRLSLEERAELTSVRLAIREQAVSLALAERQALDPNYARRQKSVASSEASVEVAQKKLEASEKRLNEKLISEEQFFAAKQKLTAARAALNAEKADLEARDIRLAVKDEEIKLLKLRSVLVETRLKQLKRRLSDK